MAKLRVVLSVFGSLLAGCQTVPQTLDSLLNNPDAIRLPITQSKSGLMMVDVGFGADQTGRFIIDTGATRSVIFSSRAKTLDLNADGEVRVHGLAGTEIIPAVRLAELRLGRDRMSDVKLAVLPDRAQTSDVDEQADGLLGLDILSRFRIASDTDMNALILLPLSETEPVIPDHWGQINLGDNPYSDAAGALRFFDVRMNGRVGPALLDTGSSINVMTFEFASFPAVKRARRTLRENYEIEGAVRAFQPRVIVKDVDFRAGSKIWYGRDFIVKDVESLDVIGVSGRPFLIAGADLLAGQAFYLDVTAGVLRLPRGASPQDETVTGSRIARDGTRGATVIQARPEARN